MAYHPPYRLTAAQLRRDIPVFPRNALYVGSDATGHYFVPKGDAQGLGDIGDMFKRMFKFTSKSFTPANISRSIWRLTPTSVALQLVAPKIERTIHKDVVPIAVPVAAGIALTAAIGPSVWSALSPKLSAAAGFIGKNAGTIGGFLGKMIGGMSEAGQSKVAQEITPQQIAAIEQTGTIPADVQALLAQAAAMQPPMPIMAGATGAAELYPGGGLPPPKQASMFEGNEAVMMMGGLAVIAILFGSKK